MNLKRLLFIASLITLATIAFFASAIFAQQPHTIVFYNVENFFDTIDDPDTDDAEFTPKGKNKWTVSKYSKKLSNIECVLSDISEKNGGYPTLIGLAEIEVRSVLEDIVATPKLKGANYQIAHFDSPDARGVDVALLYRPDQFKIEGSKAIRAVVPDVPNFRSRDILSAWGTIENEEFFVMVAHWSSRGGGQAKTESRRMATAAQMRTIVDSVRTMRPDTKFILMGDFNDDPNDKSVVESLGAKLSTDDLSEGDLYTPFYTLMMAGYGTLAYGGEWNLFDNIVVSENLVNPRSGELKLQESIYNSKYNGNIFRPSYLFQQSGKYKGYPFRSFSGGEFIEGYSDHLPVFINID